jgi:glycosyltransferase involved in cell wall biosynthesis
MQVSIIINNFNYGSYLKEAIDSALNQTWSDVEVIVVDDGSEDNSADVIDSYAQRIKPLYKENGGQCSSINAGFIQSHGDVVILLDADDYLLPNAAELHATRMQNPDVVNSCGYLDVVDVDGTMLGQRVPFRLGKSGDYAAATLEHGLDIYGVTFTSGHAWSRKFLQQVLPLPENDLPGNELIGVDGYLTAVDRLFGRIEFIHEPVGRYRRHGKNRGPMTLQMTEAFLQKRIDGRNHRTEFARDWALKLGHPVDIEKLGRIRDWHNVLMRHSLSLIADNKPSVGLGELVTAPYRRINGGLWRSTMLASALFMVKCLPRKLSLSLSERLLSRVPRGRRRKAL